ncbi:MAG: DUF4836 family protein [Clostridium sp.]|nr:DUF4836 family protein [Prevotella sp.]MCM1428523.1 DUF4836 family protein [Clostridium sp.]
MFQKTFIRGINLFALAAIIMVLASCSNRNADRLLSTIPSEARAVAVADIEMICEHAGLSEEKNSEAILKIARAGSVKESVAMHLLADGKSGVSPTVAGVFLYNENVYFTCFIEDEDQFLNFLKTIDPEMEKKDGGWVVDRGHGVVYDGQFWSCSGTMDVMKAKMFSKLDKDKSYASSTYAEKLATPLHDVAFIADTEALISGMNKTDQAPLRLAMSTAFDSPKYFAGSLTFAKGRADVEIDVLNDKFEPARISIKPATISRATLDDFRGNGDLYMSAALSQEGLKNILGQGAAMGLPSEFSDMLANFDGTIVGGLSFMQFMASGGRGGYAIQVGFNSETDAGEAVEPLRNLFSGLSVNSRGKYVYLDMGIKEGKMQPAVAAKLENTTFGMAMDFGAISNLGVIKDAESLKLAWLSVTPKDGSLKIAFTIDTAPSNINSLQTLIKFINSNAN